MAYPNITPLPTPPNPDAPATFDTLAYPFTQAQVTLAAQINALVGQLNATFFPDMPVLATITGSAATPVYSWGVDPNTGMYRAGVDTLAFSTAGIERLRITATGLLQSSTAIVTGAADVTTGRLLTTGAGPAQAYRQGNILGTVAASGGAPTGAIIERGSNANGEYVRFADGTQICVAFLTSANGIQNTNGSVYVSDQMEWVFPVSFGSSNVVVSASCVNTGNVWCSGRVVSVSGGSALAFSGSSLLITINLRVSAIGRWF